MRNTLSIPGEQIERLHAVLLSLLAVLAGAILSLAAMSYSQLCRITEAIETQTAMLQGADNPAEEPKDTEAPPSDAAPKVVAIKARVSAYTASRRETDADPGRTATMERPIPGWTCAVSRDLAHWLGGRVWIEGVGVRKVNDLMHSRHKRQVDVLVGKAKEAAQITADERKVVFLGKG